MARKYSPSTVFTVPLQVNIQQQKQLERVFEAARLLDNHLKGEGEKMIRNIRQSKAWNRARAMPRGQENSPERKARAMAFQAVKDSFDCEQEEFCRRARAFGKDKLGNDNQIGDCLPAPVEQKIAQRVFGGVERRLYGVSKRARFKSVHRGVKSLEGKSDESGIRWRLKTSEGKIRTLDPELPAQQQAGCLGIPHGADPSHQS